MRERQCVASHHLCKRLLFNFLRRDMCLHQARVPFVLKSKLGVSSLARKHCLVCDVSRNLRMAPSLVGAMFLERVSTGNPGFQVSKLDRNLKVRISSNV